MTSIIAPGGITFDGTMSDGDMGKRLQQQLTKVNGISELFIVSAYAFQNGYPAVTGGFLNTIANPSSVAFTGSTVEVGSTVIGVTLDWLYNRNTDDPISQTINHGVGALAVALRTYFHTPVSYTTNQDYGFSVEGDEGAINTFIGDALLNFQYKNYFGVSATDITAYSDANKSTFIKANFTGIFDTDRAETQTYNCTGGWGLYYWCWINWNR